MALPRLVASQPSSQFRSDPGIHLCRGPAYGQPLLTQRGALVKSERLERFRRELVERTVVHGVARSFEDAVAWLREWGVLRPLRVQ